ncbi:MAG: ROK family protein [candidate division Zixibacteria bacterium]
MSTETSFVLGIDIGGSFIKAAIVDCCRGEISGKLVKEPSGVHATPEEIKSILRKIVSLLKWKGSIGVGYPGVVIDGICRSAANVDDGWLGCDLTELLSDLTDNSVAVINDADAAGMAELRFGGAKDENHVDGKSVLMLTFGTGIGSALFYCGKLYPNTEFGHIELDNVDAETRAAASVRVSENLTWEEYATRVNRYLHAIEGLLSPELILLGGGISENFYKFGPLLKTRARLIPAELGNQAGLIGAALSASD